MQRFIACENIKRFRRQLEGCTDAAEQAVLLELIAKEEARLKELRGTGA